MGWRSILWERERNQRFWIFFIPETERGSKSLILFLFLCVCFFCVDGCGGEGCERRVKVGRSISDV